MYVTACDLRSHSVSKQQLKVQTKYTFPFVCRHTVVNTCYISWGMGLRKVLNGQNGLQGHSRLLGGLLLTIIRPHDFLLVFHISCMILCKILALCYTNDLLTYLLTSLLCLYLRSEHVTLTAPLVIPRLIFDMAYMYTKFEDSSFTRSKNTNEHPERKNRVI